MDTETGVVLMPLVLLLEVFDLSSQSGLQDKYEKA